MPLDELDLALIHALRIDGRAPFSLVAEVLGTSQQTVARRYRRLRSEGVVRVIAMTDPRRLGQVEWFVRLHCTPDAAARVAEALARRTDTSWVQLTSGGTEITCITRATEGTAPDALLLRQLPRTPRVVSVSAHCLLHNFVGGPVGWAGAAKSLDDAQIARLSPPAPEPREIDLAGDTRLLELLRTDGRAGFAELAAALGQPESTVRRRIALLRGSGLLYWDIEVDPVAVGYAAQAMLWLSVPQRDLVAAAGSLARQPEVAFVAATTGPTNLVANVLCRDVDALYSYLTERITGIDSIGTVETAPVIRTLKRAATLA